MVVSSRPLLLGLAWMVLRVEGPTPRRRMEGESRLRLLIIGRKRVVGVRPSDGLGGGSVGVLGPLTKGLVGVRMLRPPHREQRYLSTVVCPWVFTWRDPGFPTRRGW